MISILPILAYIVGSNGARQRKLDQEKRGTLPPVNPSATPSPAQTSTASPNDELDESLRLAARALNWDHIEGPKQRK
jgi:hypothetical protein